MPTESGLASQNQKLPLGLLHVWQNSNSWATIHGLPKMHYQESRLNWRSWNLDWHSDTGCRCLRQCATVPMPRVLFFDQHYKQCGSRLPGTDRLFYLFLITAVWVVGYKNWPTETFPLREPFSFTPFITCVVPN